MWYATGVVPSGLRLVPPVVIGEDYFAIDGTIRTVDNVFGTVSLLIISVSTREFLFPGFPGSVFVYWHGIRHRDRADRTVESLDFPSCFFRSISLQTAHLLARPEKTEHENNQHPFTDPCPQ